ncbi:MAG: polysulfide reductase NrfD [Candidatus Marinimicrobia bacterium]|jgi:Ni/Fe-hydrogenase subunit HybB-like protein|nr:polysulfide reductase NrfD [Candidatus Neomarinimicrobiota bacterium]MBT7556820.1 polysulfide reductase NrfD [Candidatus Woesearchaeota archaeon]MBT3839905.1 polysulfide reductase NrfD [Candidatus Neomarinimicrobiota bacterium]MBT3998481.1 polysulfide reductase NrfD [Candidatus Neomarinimicrobiota bacterium]MBT4957571.1 polysulfide reductase NrfD [Candidatus Neomarinimicrobiota bacterium]
MKHIVNSHSYLPIISHNKTDEKEWTFKEKMMLGLLPKEYFLSVLKNRFNWIFLLILIIGIPLIIQRYVVGLGAVTHSSNDYPWGLFLAFGLFTMVPLSASGFLLGTTVEIFGRHDYHPIERLALLGGLLGYLFAVIYLLLDLGIPWHLPYPMFVSLGPAAVLFLVAWHVATYLSVQIAEVSPAFFEWIGWLKAKAFVRKWILGLTISGIILSTLHQGALGALFTYAPAKIHPLWYSTFQWWHFFVSSIAAGLAMVIVVSTLVKKFMAWRCDHEFLDNLDRLTIGLARGISLTLITYVVIKFIGIAHDNEWAYLSTGWGHYFILEMSIFGFIPMVLFGIGIKNTNMTLIRFTAFLTVIGLAMNRINTTLVAFNWKLYQEVPHWKEFVISMTIFTIYIIVYRFILYRFPILYSWKGEK